MDGVSFGVAGAGRPVEAWRRRSVRRRVNLPCLPNKPRASPEAEQGRRQLASASTEGSANIKFEVELAASGVL